MQTVKWWQNAVIYHIVPRSFLDTSGDGEGDLNGIIAKLEFRVEEAKANPIA